MPRRCQRAVDRGADVVGVAARDRVVARTPPPPELGRDHDLVAAAGERAAEELLALAVAVALGGVEQGDPGVERRVDDGAASRRRRAASRSCCSRARRPRRQARGADSARRASLEPTYRFRATTWIDVPVLASCRSRSARRPRTRRAARPRSGRSSCSSSRARLHEQPGARPLVVAGRRTGRRSGRRGRSSRRSAATAPGTRPAGRTGARSSR